MQEGQCATVTCFCKETSILFHNPSPRLGVFCVCPDCVGQLDWCSEKAGRATTKSNVEQPVLRLFYFDSDVTVIKGAENLVSVKLRENGETERLTSSCCWSTLACHHWAYKNCTMVIAEGCHLEGNQSIEPYCCIQTKWWRGKQEDLEHHTNNVKMVRSDHWWWPLQVYGIFLGIFRADIVNKRGTTVEALLKQAQKVIVGLPPAVLQNTN